jgi:hypothetical protein
MGPRDVHPRRAIGLLLTGTLTSFLAGATGAAIVGPAVRHVFGAARDYASDYESPQALMQALIVQTATLAAAFLFSGWVVSRVVREFSWKTALWVANPVTVGLAFLLLMLWLEGAYVPDGQLTWEYIGPVMWGVQLCLAAPLHASALMFGARMGRRRPEASQGPR